MVLQTAIRRYSNALARPERTPNLEDWLRLVAILTADVCATEAIE
jgi:hypothetical protein